MTTHAQNVHILMVVTSNARLGDSGRQTGFWIEELAAPYNTFIDAGFAVTIASPLGGAAPIDPGSLDASFVTADVTRFQADATAMAALADTTRLGTIDNLAGFAAIFLVGGHGTMWDFTPNADLDRLLQDANQRDLVVSAVCHGVAGLLGTAGTHYVRDRLLTGFSDGEEAMVGLTEVVPFLLETRLRAEGGAVETGPAFQPKIVVDGRLVTGQNPSSSRGTAEAVASLLAR